MFIARPFVNGFNESFAHRRLAAEELFAGSVADRSNGKLLVNANCFTSRSTPEYTNGRAVGGTDETVALPPVILSSPTLNSGVPDEGWLEWGLSPPIDEKFHLPA